MGVPDQWAAVKGGPPRTPVKYHYFHRFFTYSVGRDARPVRSGGGRRGVLEPSVLWAARGAIAAGVVVRAVPSARPVPADPSVVPGFAVAGAPRSSRGPHRTPYVPRRDPIRGHCQAGSLTGAVHLSKNNAGVLRPAQRGQKPRVKQKGKSWLDPGVQYAQGLRKHGLSIL